MPLPFIFRAVLTLSVLLMLPMLCRGASVAATLRSQIMAAYRSGQTTYTIPAATYTFAASSDTCYMRFSSLSNFTIDATGSTFICTSPLEGFAEFDNCVNVTFKGGLVRHDPVPFSQGVITNIPSSGNYVDVTIDAGYPTNVSNQKYFFSGGAGWLDDFDATTNSWKVGVTDLDFSSIKMLTSNSFRAYQDVSVKGTPVKVGDPVAWRGTIAYEVMIQNSTAFTLTGTTFQSSSGFVVYEYGGQGGDSYSYTIQRGPAPTGATIPPLLSANADGLHSTGTRQGPSVTNCNFSYMDDDAVAINGSYGVVMNVDNTGQSITIAGRNGDTSTGISGVVGDTLKFYGLDGSLTGSATILSVQTLSGYSGGNQVPQPFASFQEPSELVYEQIQLSQPVGAVYGSLFVNYNAEGGGFSVSNCNVSYNRARGLNINSTNGQLSGNNIVGCTLAGILMSPQMQYYPQADYSTNVTVTGNTIKNVWTSEDNGVYESGALTIAEYWNGQYVPLPGGFANITISGNTFDTINGCNIVISSAQNISVTNNTFVNSMQLASDRGLYVGITQNALCWVTQSSGITFSGNTIENPGPYLQTDVSATSTATVSAGF